MVTATELYEGEKNCKLSQFVDKMKNLTVVVRGDLPFNNIRQWANLNLKINPTAGLESIFKVSS